MKEFFADPELGLIGLLFFVTFFCLVTLWTYRPSGKANYKNYGDIPFKEKDE